MVFLKGTVTVDLSQLSLNLEVVFSYCLLQAATL